jgi:membrane protein
MPIRSNRERAARLAGRLRDWSRRNLSRDHAGGARGPGAWFLRQVYYFDVTLRGALRDSDIALRSSALTYHTLLSIVPLLAVAFSLFKAFGGLRQLEGPLRGIIVENLAVGTAAQVSGYLDQFIENISAGAIGGVGFAFLIYTVWRMLANVEGAFNAIWGVTQGRSAALSFVVYWTLISLAPILVAFSISLPPTLEQLPGAQALIGRSPTLVSWLLEAVSVISICVAFSLAFRIMPKTAVRWRAALMGGLVAGVIWHLSKLVYLYLSATIFRYGAIYGALGVLPIFFIWIRLSWVIVLSGARYSFIYQQGLLDRATASLPMATQRYRERQGLRLCVALAAFKKALEGPVAVETLAKRIGTAPTLVLEALRALESKGLVIKVQQPSGTTYTLSRDTEDVSADDVVSTLRGVVGTSYTLRDDGPWAPVDELLDRAEAAAREALASASLLDLVERCEGEPS